MTTCTRTYKGTVTITYNGDELGMTTRVVAVYVGPNTHSAGDTTNVKYILEAVAVEEAYREKQESDAAEEPVIVERPIRYGPARNQNIQPQCVGITPGAARIGVAHCGAPG